MYVATPHVPGSEAKVDFNDVLLHEGVDIMTQQIQEARLEAEGLSLDKIVESALEHQDTSQPPPEKTLQDLWQHLPGSYLPQKPHPDFQDLSWQATCKQAERFMQELASRLYAQAPLDRASFVEFGAFKLAEHIQYIRDNQAMEPSQDDIKVLENRVWFEFKVFKQCIENTTDKKPLSLDEKAQAWAHGERVASIAGRLMEATYKNDDRWMSKRDIPDVIRYAEAEIERHENNYVVNQGHDFNSRDARLDEARMHHQEQFGTSVSEHDEMRFSEKADYLGRSKTV